MPFIGTVPSNDNPTKRTRKLDYIMIEMTPIRTMICKDDSTNIYLIISP